MKNLLLALFLGLLTLGVGIGDAEAARLGGGKSFGMQRQSVAPRPVPAAPANQAAPAPTPRPTPAAPTPATPKRNWLGPLAGLAAGLGIAALLSHFGFGEGMANIVMIALLAMAAVFVLKLLFGRKAEPATPSRPLQFAGATPPDAPTSQREPFAPAHSPAPVPEASPIPDGFDRDGFLRVAKLNFVRLQAANDAGNLDDMREFLAPEVFAEIRLQVEERGKSPQQTDIVTLNAELLEVVTEGTRHIASVHFSGMIRETAGAAATAFSEVWNLSKPVSGTGGWLVSGIQQIG